MDADTKLIPAFLVGKRDAYHAKMFISDLADRMHARVQVSSDSLPAFTDAVERGFGSEVDYGQISKTFAFENLNKSAAGRYSPAEVVKSEKTVVSGMGPLDGASDERTRFVAVLEIPPVDSAIDAVRVQIVKDTTKRNKHESS